MRHFVILTFTFHALFPFYAQAKSDVNFEMRALLASQLAAGYRSSISLQDFIKRAKPLHNDDQNLVDAAVATKQMPRMYAQDDKIIFGENQYKIVLRIVDLNEKRFEINGHAFKLDPKRSIREQVHQALAPKKTAVFSLFTATAYATDPWLDWLLLQLSLRAGGGAVAASGTAVAGVLIGALVVFGTLLGGAYCYANATASYESDKWNSFWNCMFSPLDFIGMNPRNNMTLSDVRCPNEYLKSISLEFTSKSRKFSTLTYEPSETGSLQRVKSHSSDLTIFRDETITFDDMGAKALTGHKLVRELKGVGSEKVLTDKRLSRPQDSIELDSHSAFALDFDYFQGLCANPERLAKFKEQIKSGEKRKDLPQLREDYHAQ